MQQVAFSNSVALNPFFTFFLSSADFFQNQLFRKILSGISSECQTNWIQIRPEVLSDLIWVQSVCKGFEQTSLVGKRVNYTNSLPMKGLFGGIFHFYEKFYSTFF